MESKSIPIDAIVVTKSNPRKTFNQAAIDGLAESIKVHGVLQPIVVRPHTQPPSGHDKVGKSLRKHGVVETTGRFELVVGERRLRAAKQAGLKEIPARIAHGMTAADAADVRLVENDQRE